MRPPNRYCRRRALLWPAWVNAPSKRAPCAFPQVMKNLGAILEEAGSSFDKVVKTTILLVRMRFQGSLGRWCACSLLWIPA